MNKISVCSVIYNEANYLEDCFNHLKPYVDDFVVIDQESTDNSVEIAKKFTDKVITLPRIYYPYGYIHQAALLANNDLILKSDPDERFDDILLNYFETISNSDYDIIHFRMAINGVIGPGWQPRMFRKNKVLWTDSLDSRPITYGFTKFLNVNLGHITHLKDIKESNGRYRKEAAKRLLVRYGDTKIPEYVGFCKYYEFILRQCQD